MCHNLLFLFLCIAFRILSLYRTTAARRTLLGMGCSCFTFRCLRLSGFSCYSFFLCGSLFGRGSIASDEAYPIGNDIINIQDGKLLEMTATMADTIRGCVPENYHLFTAIMLNGSGDSQ